MKRINLFLIVAAVIMVCGNLIAATNYVKEGDAITLTWSSTSPSAGSPVVKGTSKATGAIVGVALNGLGVPSESVTVATKGVFNLSVTASSTVGNIAVGDFIYSSMAGITTCTADLSNINTGVLFGQALEAIPATSTAGVYSTIKVMLRQPGHL